MSDLQAMKAGSKARESEEKRLADRRRSTLVLILRHLADNGYIDSYERLSTESNISLNKVDVADNVDLLRVVQEYEDYYEFRFQKAPKLVRRLVAEVQGGGGGMRGGGQHNGVVLPPVGHQNGQAGPSPPTSAKRVGALEGPPMGGAMAAKLRRERGEDSAKKSEQLERRQTAMDSIQPPAELGVQRIAGVAVGAGNKVISGMGREEIAAMQIQGMAQVAGLAVGRPPLGRRNSAAGGLGGRGGSHGGNGNGGGGGSDDSDPDEFFEQRVLKPIPASLQGELRDLAMVLQRDIFCASPNVRWDSVAGLDEAKRLLKEAVVAPIKYPHLFTGLLAPWKGVLLYGPPGTGKTMLAKAVATECRTTFFNISASSIVSKWRGDSEKIVRVLFELARHHAPSTIFMDEIDALMQARGGEGEHEASRRMKTELLTQIDGISKTNDLVFLLAATNLPWELDAAMLRRLEKRILVTLPTQEARKCIFDHLLTGRCAPDVSMDALAKQSEGFSGSDVHLAAKEAAMRPLRRLLTQLADEPTTSGAKDGKAAAEVKVPPVTVEDTEAAMRATKATGMTHAKEYDEFTQAYGQVT